MLQMVDTVTRLSAFPRRVTVTFYPVAVAGVFCISSLVAVGGGRMVHFCEKRAIYGCALKKTKTHYSNLQYLSTPETVVVCVFQWLSSPYDYLPRKSEYQSSALSDPCCSKFGTNLILHVHSRTFIRLSVNIATVVEWRF